MADTTVLGRFVWHELMTSDTASAHAFYPKVLGWKAHAREQDASSTEFAAASGPLAGIWQSPAGAPHWLPYIATPDIVATLEQARVLGARVSKDVTELSHGGQYAVLDDPQGAAFGIYSSPADAEPERAPEHGEYSWHELLTTDFRAAFDFYSTLFGWEQIDMVDMGPMGIYFMFGRDGKPTGGMFNRTDEMPGRPAWLGYVRVKNLQQTVDRVKAAGGSIQNGPMEVPGGDWIAQFADPQGAMFAVHTLAADLKKPETTAKPRATAQGAIENEATATAPTRSRAKARKRPAAKKKAAAKSTPRKKSAAVAKKSAKKATKKSAKKSAKRSARKAPKKRRQPAARRPAAKTKRSKTARRGQRRAGKASKVAQKAAKKRSGAKKRVLRRPRKAK